jgi:hypothetical protein
VGLLSAIDAVSEHRAGTLLESKRDRIAPDVIVLGMVERLVEHQGAKVAAADGVGNSGPELSLFPRCSTPLPGKRERSFELGPRLRWQPKPRVASVQACTPSTAGVWERMAFVGQGAPGAADSLSDSTSERTGPFDPCDHGHAERARFTCAGKAMASDDHSSHPCGARQSRSMTIVETERMRTPHTLCSRFGERGTLRAGASFAFSNPTPKKRLTDALPFASNRRTCPSMLRAFIEAPSTPESVINLRSNP